MTYATGRMYLVGAIAAVGLAVAIGKGWRHVGVDPAQGVLAPPVQAFDPQRFMLNALLAPALDRDDGPLRFVDPRRAANCQRGTFVAVDGEPLVTQSLVPEVPFDLEWQMRGCRPFGESGPRFDGYVRLHVFREDWGFTASVEGGDLTITPRRGSPQRVTRSAVSMPQEMDEQD